jgi:hypothetical protein
VVLALEDQRTLMGYVNDVQADALILGNLCSDQVAPIPYGWVRGLRGLNVADGARVSVSKMPNGTAKLVAGPPCGAANTQGQYVDHGNRNRLITGAVALGIVIIVDSTLLRN